MQGLSVVRTQVLIHMLVDMVTGFWFKCLKSSVHMISYIWILVLVQVLMVVHMRMLVDFTFIVCSSA